MTTANPPASHPTPPDGDRDGSPEPGHTDRLLRDLAAWVHGEPVQMLVALRWLVVMDPPDQQTLVGHLVNIETRLREMVTALCDPGPTTGAELRRELEGILARYPHPPEVTIGIPDGPLRHPTPRAAAVRWMVLVEMVNNAARHSAGGTVRIEITPGRDRWVIRMVSHPPDDPPRPRMVLGRGWSLGLRLIRRILDDDGGSLEVTAGPGGRWEAVAHHPAGD